jgi:SAM-dependent methyltransferase
MTTGAYDVDLAHIHDQGYGAFASGSAPGLLRLLRRAGIRNGRIVDLGCGSGIWAHELTRQGYECVGVDVSEAMIEIARRRNPQAEFHVTSFRQFEFPPCRAVTALGEVFNYQFDENHSLDGLQTVWRSVFEALAPGGLFIFDVAGPERCRGRTQAFREGDDWTCLVEFERDEGKSQLTRRIVTFRKIGDLYRRREEIHRQQLFEPQAIERSLRGIGFQVTTVSSYGDHPLAENVFGFVARKPEKL